MVNLCFLLAGKVFKVQVFKRSQSHRMKRVAEERRKPRLHECHCRSGYDLARKGEFLSSYKMRNWLWMEFMLRMSWG